MISKMSPQRISPTPLELKRLKKWQISTLAVMLFGYVGYYLCRKNITAALPLLAEAFNYSKTDLGKIGSAALIVYGIGKLINGPLGDKIGGRKVFLAGMIGSLACNLLFAWGSSLTWFIITWSLGHYFLSMGWGGLAKTVGAWCAPEKNGTVMGIISINFQFGGVVATLLSGAIVSYGFGWQYVFTIPAAILFLVFIWSALTSKASPQDLISNIDFPISSNHKAPSLRINKEDKASPIIIMKKLFGIRLFHVLLVFSSLTTVLRQIFFFWTALLFTDIGLDIKDAIFKSAMFPLAGCLGTLFLGWYTDKYAKDGDRAHMMWIMLVGLTASLILMAFFSRDETLNSTVVVILTAFAGFFLLGPYSMSSGCLTLDIAGSEGAGTCTGLIDGIGYLVASLSIYLSGWMSDTYGWSSVFYLLIICSILSTLCCVYMSSIYRKKALLR